MYQSRRLFLLAALLAISGAAVAAPRVASTELIGSFSGHDAALHPDNQAPIPIEYYGTDLGFTYQHQGQIHILFGDTWATEAYAPIESSTGARFDDGFGTIDPAGWEDPGKIGPNNIPRIRLGQHEGSGEMSAIDPGHAMDLGHTPMGGFSNGNDQFGIFNITKPQGCRQDSDCANGLSCDSGLGYYGTPYSEETGLTLPCIDGMPLCQAQTEAGDEPAPSGFCIDRSSTVWAETPTGRVSSSGLRVLIGMRSKSDPRKYTDTRTWLTNKFVNVTARTVDDFAPAGGTPAVLLWGRPGFVGVGANGRSLGLYFGYVDMPQGADYAWKVNYYTGTQDGVPQFSANEAEAAPLDLDAGETGTQPAEPHDVVHQMSVSFVEALNKWVMFYGGGISVLPSPVLPSCGVLELFARFECKDVDIGNGGIHMRTADHPFGPWSPPQEVVAGGDPDVPNSGQYGPGGALHHPACTGENCATPTRTVHYHDNEYGFLYAANIIEPWTHASAGGVEILWNASTWDPYRVVLFRTLITP
jgi:hypothetical protein